MMVLLKYYFRKNVLIEDRLTNQTLQISTAITPEVAWQREVTIVFKLKSTSIFILAHN